MQSNSRSSPIDGVPANVIDVMLALSYPKALAVNPVGQGVTRQNTDSAYDSYRYTQPLNPLLGFDGFGFPIYASESALMYGCSPFMYGTYGYGMYDMGLSSLYSSPFGCGGGYGFAGYPGYGGYYGYGGYPYYGGYFGGGPVVVPSRNRRLRPHLRTAGS